jgi:hypothetical protein
VDKALNNPVNNGRTDCGQFVDNSSPLNPIQWLSTALFEILKAVHNLSIFKKHREMKALGVLSTPITLSNYYD